MIGDNSPLFTRLRILEWMEVHASSNELLHLITPSLHWTFLRTYDFPDAEDSSDAFAAWVSRVSLSLALIARDLKYLGIEAIGELDVSLALDYFRSLDVLNVRRINVYCELFPFVQAWY